MCLQDTAVEAGILLPPPPVKVGEALDTVYTKKWCPASGLPVPPEDAKPERCVFVWASENRQAQAFESDRECVARKILLFHEQTRMNP